MLARLDDMAYENELMRLRTQKMIHLLPKGFLEQVQEVGKQINILRTTLPKQ